MKTGVYHSDRPFFANINALNQKKSFFDEKNTFSMAKRCADFTNTHVADCCGGFCVSFQIM
jgi:hypothetical protein